MKIKAIKKINTIAALVVGLAIVIFVFLGILFPQFKYVMNTPDSHGIAVREKEFGEQSILFVSPFFNYQFSSIYLKLESEQGFSDIPSSFDVFKGYVAQRLEEGEAIQTEQELSGLLWKNNQSEIANGNLISYADTVYFVTDGKVRTILSPEIFVQLGFDWNAVEKVDADEFAIFEKAEHVDFGSLHPSGTLFKSESGHFLAVNGKKRMVENDLENAIPETIRPIELKSEELVKVGKCLIQEGSQKIVKCSLEPGQTTEIIGNDYIFEIPSSTLELTQKGTVTFNTLRGMRRDIARSSLKRIKDRLAIRYFPEIIR